MSIYGDALQEKVLIKLFKLKKKEQKKLNEDEFKEAEKQFENLIKFIKKLIPELKRSKEFKELQKTANKKLVDDWDMDIRSTYCPDFIVEIEEDINVYGEAILLINDEEQEIREEYNEFLEWICKRILSNNEFNFKCDIGDGDEGCIYLKYVW